MIKSAYLNILEASLVDLDLGAENANFPLYRLYDRNPGKLFKAQAAVTLEVDVDQGTSPVAVDSLFIPAGHNLEGETLDIMYSTDDITYTPAVTQWAGDSGIIQKSWTPLTKRYWKFIVTSPSVIPELGELFLSQTYDWVGEAQNPYGPIEDITNSVQELTSSGSHRAVVLGVNRRQFIYNMRVKETDKTAILALWDIVGLHTPFFIDDGDDTWIYVRFRETPDFIQQVYQIYTAIINTEEVIDE